ncbi:MAG: hypothetical protein JRI72_15725 [Deltaproteobacteria bacterium]|nr:hypothetical protein [Deltaproteobacteria bacterium]
MIDIFAIPNTKIIRAEVIMDRLPAGTKRIICLSCGNASKALKETIKSVPVISVDPRSPVQATRELTIDELWQFFGPDSFNATSGYLPLDWVEAIGQRLIPYVPKADKYFIPCGSGETLMALSFFIPLAQMVGVTANYPPIEMIGPLSRWLRRNIEIFHAGHVRSVMEALELAGRGQGVALCWE